MHDLDFTRDDLPSYYEIQVWCQDVFREYPDAKKTIRAIYKRGLICNREREALLAIQTLYPLPK